MIIPAQGTRTLTLKEQSAEWVRADIHLLERIADTLDRIEKKIDVFNQPHAVGVSVHSKGVEVLD